MKQNADRNRFKHFREKKLLQQRNVRINNSLCMENRERYNNILLGYSIQATRISRFIQNIADELIEKQKVTDQQKEQTEKASTIMKEIQCILRRLATDECNYKKHLISNTYCKIAMMPYKKKLEQIIVNVDKLLNG